MVAVVANFVGLATMEFGHTRCRGGRHCMPPGCQSLDGSSH